MQLRKNVLIIAFLLLLLSLLLFIEPVGDRITFEEEYPDAVGLVLDGTPQYYGHKLATVILIVISAAVIIAFSIITERNRFLTWKNQWLLFIVWAILVVAIIFAIIMWAEFLVGNIIKYA